MTYKLGRPFGTLSLNYQFFPMHTKSHNLSYMYIINLSNLLFNKQCSVPILYTGKEEGSITKNITDSELYHIPTSFLTNSVLFPSHTQVKRKTLSAKILLIQKSFCTCINIEVAVDSKNMKYLRAILGLTFFITVGTGKHNCKSLCMAILLDHPRQSL